MYDGHYDARGDAWWSFMGAGLALVWALLAGGLVRLWRAHRLSASLPGTSNPFAVATFYERFARGELTDESRPFVTRRECS